VSRVRGVYLLCNLRAMRGGPNCRTLSSLSHHLTLSSASSSSSPLLFFSTDHSQLLGLFHGYYAGMSSSNFAISHIPRVLICFFSCCASKHYVWAGGHFILLISALRYILAWAALKTPSLWWYKGSAPTFAEMLHYGLIMTCG
jgi:hypothetical protein